jgi:hypothetical protein
LSQLLARRMPAADGSAEGATPLVHSSVEVALVERRTSLRAQVQVSSEALAKAVAAAPRSVPAAQLRELLSLGAGQVRGRSGAHWGTGGTGEPANSGKSRADAARARRRPSSPERR